MIWILIIDFITNIYIIVYCIIKIFLFFFPRMPTKWWLLTFRLLLWITPDDCARPYTFVWRCWPCANVHTECRRRPLRRTGGVWPNCRPRPANCPNRYRRRLIRNSSESNRRRITTNSSSCRRPVTKRVRGATIIRGPRRPRPLYEQIFYLQRTRLKNTTAAKTCVRKIYQSHNPPSENKTKNNNNNNTVRILTCGFRKRNDNFAGQDQNKIINHNRQLYFDNIGNTNKGIR